MKKLILIAVFAVFSASSAIAVTPAIGVSYNQAGYAGEGIEKNFDESGSLRTTTEEYGAFSESYGSVFIELGLNDVIAVGVDYVPSGIKSPTNVSREGSGSSAAGNQSNPGNSSVSADFEDLLTVYAKVNVPFLGGTYLKAGFSQVDVVINESMSSGNTYKDVNTEGYMAGIGYNHEIANGVSIRAEATVNQFDDVQSNFGVATSGNRNEVFVESMWGARGTISVVKSF